MNLSTIRPFLSSIANHFENQLILPLNNQQKKIIAIATSILGIVLSYVFYRCYFKAKVIPLPKGKNDIAVGDKEKIAGNSEFLRLRDWGRELYTQEKWAEATARFERALAINPRDPETLVTCAHALERQEKWEEASEKYEEALADQPQSAYLLEKAAFPLEKRKKWQEAGAMYAQILKDYPDTPHVRVKYANILGEQNKYSEAIEQYNEVLKTSPTDFFALVGCADMLGRQKKWPEVIARYETAFTYTPINEFTIIYVKEHAQALSNVGNYTEAATMYQQILKIVPNYFSALVGYGDVLVRQNKFPEALKTYQQALDINPTHKATLKKHEKIVFAQLKKLASMSS